MLITVKRLRCDENYNTWVFLNCLSDQTDGGRYSKWAERVRERESTIIKCHLTKFRGRCDQACQFDNDCVRHRSRLRSCRLLTFFHVRSLDGELAVKNSFLLALCGSQCIFLIVFLMAGGAAKTALTFLFCGRNK